jgi:hypothetical protein
MMTELNFNDAGGLRIVPSPDSSHKDFDFYIGKWRIKNRKLKTRLNDCTEWMEFEATDEVYKSLNGLGNTGHFRTSFGNKPFEGMTLRLFNPATKLWSIYWADSDKGTLDAPVTGSFTENTGRFYTRDIFEGKEIIMMFHWDKTDRDNPVWSQAFSADNGKSWEWNWYMYASRIS